MVRKSFVTLRQLVTARNIDILDHTQTDEKESKLALAFLDSDSRIQENREKSTDEGKNLEILYLNLNFFVRGLLTRFSTSFLRGSVRPSFNQAIFSALFEVPVFL